MVSEPAVAELRSMLAIRELRYAYAYHIDHHNWDEWERLYAEDAWWSSTLHDRYESRDVIGRLGREDFAESHAHSKHQMHNPIIDVDGDEAAGTWNFEAVVVTPDGSANWSQGEYQETYVRVDGEWLFASVFADIEARMLDMEATVVGDGDAEFVEIHP